MGLLRAGTCRLERQAGKTGWLAAKRGDYESVEPISVSYLFHVGMHSRDAKSPENPDEPWRPLTALTTVTTRRP